MKIGNIKKVLLPNLPYLFFLWAFLKVGTAYRLAEGADFAHSVAFDEVNDCPMEAFLEVESIAMDSAYERPHICKRYLEVGMCCPQYIKRDRYWEYRRELSICVEGPFRHMYICSREA